MILTAETLIDAEAQEMRRLGWQELSREGSMWRMRWSTDKNGWPTLPVSILDPDDNLPRMGW